MDRQQYQIHGAPTLSKLKIKNYIHRFRTPDCFSIISELKLSTPLKLLDVGCKNGRLLFKLASCLTDYELHGVDLDIHHIRANQARNKHPHVYFHCAPAEALPFENEYFNIITCTNALRHFPQRVRALDEMHRVLKTGGNLYILEGVRGTRWKEKFDKILRQSKFIRPEKKYLPRTALLTKSYFVHYVK